MLGKNKFRCVETKFCCLPAVGDFSDFVLGKVEFLSGCSGGRYN